VATSLPPARHPPRGPRAPPGRPTPREPPPREPAARSLRPSTAQESSATPSCAAPQEVAHVAAERPLCPANKNITYIK
jgi:hypothetical protein